VSAPVAKPDSSEASHAMIDATSSGVPRRRTGIEATIFSSTSGLIARTMSVPMQPGDTAFAVTPSEGTSGARWEGSCVEPSEQVLPVRR
jgi:hypothetical protein